MKAKNIVRHSIVKYAGKEWVIEQQGRECLLIDADQKNGISISASKDLEVVKFPAQLAFDYLQSRKPSAAEYFDNQINQ